MENTINVADFCIENAEKIYGFGKRLAIWLQGCSLRCKGCINAHIWEFGKGKDMTLSQFENLLTPDLEGITLLGGEPLDQSENLLPFVLKAKEMGKTVVLFTGYRKRELSGPALKIWNISDVTVSGRYREDNLYKCEISSRFSRAAQPWRMYSMSLPISLASLYRGGLAYSQ